MSAVEILEAINGFVWGKTMLVLILGTGIYLMVRLYGMPLRKIPYGLYQLIRGRKSEGEGDVTPFNALMTSLSATVGTGNIAGVATAIGIGGPGALFWMWCTALVGMATKYAEGVLAVHYRETDERGKRVGGPMYYIKNGLGKKWGWLAIAFAFFGTVAGFGIGNTVQSNSVADVMQSSFGVDEKITGAVLMIFVGVVLIGGVQWISQVAGKLVPFMGALYLVAGGAVILVNIDAIPAAFGLIIDSAFTPVSAAGGFAGATVMLAIRMGVARGIFSNEAGLGSAPIAHAAAETDSPVRQGTVAMLGTFIDTIILCSITGLAIVSTGVWMGEAQGAAMSSAAFASVLPHGDKVVSVCLALFAFTTILGWSYYGERCAQYLFGTKIIIPFRVCWVAAVFIGAFLELDTVWLLADTLNAMMAIPNLIALWLLCPVVVMLTKLYFSAANDSRGREEKTDVEIGQ
ncbi:MAG: sodium:alanine symporter family protein [Cellvibrionaceae bacterium]